MVFHYQRTIYLKETDATGVIYFTEQMKLASEAFEAFLTTQGFHLADMIKHMDFFMPIVHAEADYMAPIRVGDRVQIELRLDNMNVSSFTLKAILFNQEKKQVGTSAIVHVSVSKTTGQSMPLTADMKQFLQKLS